MQTNSTPTSTAPSSPVKMRRDKVVHGIVIALIVASIPLLTPIFSDQWRMFYGQYVLEPMFLVSLLLAIHWRLRGVEEEAERRFWQLLGIGFFCWLVASPLFLAARELFPDSPLEQDIFYYGPHLLLYAAIAAALEVHPEVRDNPITYPLQLLDWCGSCLLLLGILLYFLVLPSVWSDNTSALNSSIMAHYIALDTYIVLHLWYLRRSAATGEWRSIYSWLLLGVLIWSCGDLAQELMYEEVLAELDWGTPFDLLWPAAFCAIIIATRQRSEQPDYHNVLPGEHQPLGMGPLAIYVMAPLFMHVVFYRFGNADLELRELREALVLGTTALIMGMTLVYHRLLRIENIRLTKEEALARKRLAHQAFHDQLTGLPNRNLFRDRLQLAIADSQRYQRKCAVLFCDLDNFKVINDSLGHDAGDQALLATAARLRAAVRRQDTVARFGGDEFAIIAQGLHQPLDAALLVEKIITTISQPLVVGGKNHVLTASIGVALFPDDGEDEDTLLKHADTAMYQAKLHGKNTYRLFTQSMNEAAEERMAIEQGLRHGLIEDQFAVFYQPIVALESGRTVTYEALLRWNHPERGYVAPVNFIEVAEQTGLIIPIGMWVLETACNWATQLTAVDGDPPAISVNMSARQFRDPTLAEQVANILARTGLPPARLQLEITESMALTLDATAATLDQLRVLGVRIAIDDFGTGYSSLSQLQDLAVDIVKIDRSFIHGIEANSVSEAIVQAIVNMAQALNFYVVAEGVETESELAAMKQLKCDAAQGYYLCEPLPAEELKRGWQVIAPSQRSY